MENSINQPLPDTLIGSLQRFNLIGCMAFVTISFIRMQYIPRNISEVTQISKFWMIREAN
jgi:hypothetical protein